MKKKLFKLQQLKLELYDWEEKMINRRIHLEDLVTEQDAKIEPIWKTFLGLGLINDKVCEEIDSYDRIHLFSEYNELNGKLDKLTNQSLYHLRDKDKLHETEKVIAELLVIATARWHTIRESMAPLTKYLKMHERTELSLMIDYVDILNSYEIKPLDISEEMVDIQILLLDCQLSMAVQGGGFMDEMKLFYDERERIYTIASEMADY